MYLPYLTEVSAPKTPSFLTGGRLIDGATVAKLAVVGLAGVKGGRGRGDGEDGKTSLAEAFGCRAEEMCLAY